MNKVAVTINSRKYTVMAEESSEYIEALAEHINEKIQTVLMGGTNVLGERPLVLAALNICDEYFKVHEAGYGVNEQLKACKEKLLVQSEENARLKKELDELKHEPEQLSLDDGEIENADLKKRLSESQTRVSFLEGQIRLMEEKILMQKKEFAQREREILDLIDKQ